MIPAAFDYRRATSVDDARALLADAGDDARVLAGGQSLIPFMRLRFAAPSVLVDIGGLGLSHVRLDGDTVRVGALTTHRDVAASPVAREHLPLLAEVASRIGDPQVRARGTIGGSVAHADPAAEYPALCLALGARVITTQRTVGAEEFFLGRFTTVLAPDELVLEVVFPVTAAGHAYLTVGKDLYDWALAGAMVARVADGWRVGLVNLGETPLRATAVEDALAGGATPEEAGALATTGLHPTATPRASADYLPHLAEVLTTRALRQAL